MKTLTEMLDEENTLNQTLVTERAKFVFKEWLKTVALGSSRIGNIREEIENVESTRKLLITLVDEP